MGKNLLSKTISTPFISMFLIRLFVSTIVICMFFVLGQDFLIFPGLYSSKLFGFTNRPPKDVEAMVVKSIDGHDVAIWKVRAKENVRGVYALLFHGNAESQSNFIEMQRWLRTLNITSYSVEYRGYSGRNSGWPSEEGFYADGEAAFRLIEKEEHIDPQHILVLGSSIGTGTAAYIAEKFDVGTLVLLSPYTSLRNAAAETPLFGFLAPFLKYRFPTIDYVERLTNTCVVDAHGKRDTTLSYTHSEILKQRYRGRRSYKLILDDNAGHNDIMLYARERIATAIKECLSSQFSQKLKEAGDNPQLD